MVVVLWFAFGGCCWRVLLFRCLGSLYLSSVVFCFGGWWCCSLLLGLVVLWWVLFVVLV